MSRATGVDYPSRFLRFFKVGNSVTTANYYEPEINRTYTDLARHYGAIVLPARPASLEDIDFSTPRFNRQRPSLPRASGC